LSKIVDNSSSFLRDALYSKLKHSKAVDICVGYFNIRGWNQVTESLESLRQESEAGAIRLLVGMAVPEKTAEQKILEATFHLEGGEEDVDYKIATRRALDAVQGFSEQLTWGLPSDAAARAIRDFLADLKSGVVTSI